MVQRLVNHCIICNHPKRWNTAEEKTRSTGGGGLIINFALTSITWPQPFQSIQPEFKKRLLLYFLSCVFEIERKPWKVKNWLSIISGWMKVIVALVSPKKNNNSSWQDADTVVIDFCCAMNRCSLCQVRFWQEGGGVEIA